MRRPVNAPYTISGEFGDYYGAAAKFIYHSGVDYALPTGREVYAPVSGTVTSYTWAEYHGHVVQIFDGQFYHRLMHNSSLRVTPGQRVVEGQLVALSGATGRGVTGPHVHWDICKKQTPTAFADFIPPVDWLAGKYQTQGDNMIKESDIDSIRVVMSEVEGWNGHEIHSGKHDAQIKSWVGKTWPEFIQHCWRVQPTHRVHLTDRLGVIETLLINEQNKPAKEIIKEVQVIVEKPVEVIKEVPVYTHDAETKSMITAIFNYFTGQFKTFQKYNPFKKG